MDYITAFIRYLGQVKRYSTKTLTAYQSDLEQYFLFLSGQGLTTPLPTDHKPIRNWIVRLMTDKNSARTVNRKISTLKSFYHYLIREGHITVNPMKKISSPKSTKPLPLFVDENPPQNFSTHTPLPMILQASEILLCWNCFMLPACASTS